MKPFGTVSQYKALPEEVRAMQISIAHPETVNPQTVVQMPKIFARKEAPLVHVINQSKLPVITRSNMPLNSLASNNLSMPNQQPHVFDHKIPTFMRPPKMQPAPLPSNVPLNQSMVQTIPLSQSVEPIHQIQRTTHSFIRLKPEPEPEPEPIQPSKEPPTNIQPAPAPIQSSVVEYVRQSVVLDEEGQSINASPQMRHERVYSPRQQAILEPQQYHQPQPVLVQEQVFRPEHHQLQQSVYSKESQPDIHSRVSHKRYYNPEIQNMPSQRIAVAQPDQSIQSKSQQPQLASRVAHKRIYNPPAQEHAIVSTVVNPPRAKSILDGKRIIHFEPIEPWELQGDEPVFSEQGEAVEYEDIEIIEFEPIPPLFI